MKNTLRMNQITPGTQVNGTTAIGGSQPPRNRIVAIGTMGVPAEYWRDMNNRRGGEPYSTMKPATSSDSASTRSNGGRLVSASAETKKTTNIGNSGSQNQLNSPYLPSCASMIAERLSEPAQ